MTNILYIDERPESNMLINALDVKGVSYEIHNADEAKELGSFIESRLKGFPR